MKITVIIVRILMGLMFLFASITGLLHLMPQPEMHGDAKLFMDGLMASRYFMPLLMITQLLCGLAFVIGRFVPLATVVIFPIVLNIVLYHAFLDPKTLPVAMVLLLMNLFLAYACRRNYVPLVAAKIIR